MGEIILKVSPDRDLYALWSSIVDDVVFTGTREEILDERARAAADYARTKTGEALDRADRAGTSGQDGGWQDGPLLARGGCSSGATCPATSSCEAAAATPRPTRRSHPMTRSRRPGDPRHQP